MPVHCLLLPIINIKSISHIRVWHRKKVRNETPTEQNDSSWILVCMCDRRLYHICPMKWWQWQYRRHNVTSLFISVTQFRRIFRLLTRTQKVRLNRSILTSESFSLRCFLHQSAFNSIDSKSLTRLFFYKKKKYNGQTLADIMTLSQSFFGGRKKRCVRVGEWRVRRRDSAAENANATFVDL